MVKIARFSQFLGEAVVTPIQNYTEIDLDSVDPKTIEYGGVHYRTKDGIIINFSMATQSHMEDERLRYSAVFGYGDYDKEGKPLQLDWVVYAKTPELIVQELKKMVPMYIKDNLKLRPKAITESEDKEDEWRQLTKDEWRQLTKDEKVERLMKKLDAAIEKKDLKDEDAKKLKERMDKEIKKSGPDKIRQELMKRAKEEEDIKGGGDEGGSDDPGRLDKAKELVKQEVWKGYKQPIGQFWDNVYDLMAGE